MIDRQSAGLFPDKPHTVCRAPDGKILHEEMFTRGGFSGPFSYFYHRNPITAHREVAVSTRGWAAPRAEPGEPAALKRRLFLSDKMPAGGMLLDRRVPVLFNRDVTVLLARPDATDDVYF